MGSRSTDGITTTKVLIGAMAFMITTFVALIGYVYASDQSTVKAIALDVRMIREQGITTYSHVQNNSSWIDRVEKENRDFREETRKYWGTR